MQPTIVAIDGPSGVGKSSVSKAVAHALGLPHIDTGAMYRAIALRAMRENVALDDEETLSRLASSSRIRFDASSTDPRLLLDEEDVSELIRDPRISTAASTVSALPAVRRILVRLQQEMGNAEGGVLEGRDIGTKVFPGTPHKFFLTARTDIRAERRYRQLLEKGYTGSQEQVLAEMDHRDSQDSSRADSPLTYDSSYTLLDTSELTLEQVTAAIVRKINPAPGEPS